MIWTDKMCILLIEAYRDLSVLWDPTHEYFKLKNKREAAWEELATKFQTDDVEIRKKMNSLLSSFRRERKKAVKRVSASGCIEIIYKTNWFAFKSMLFLNERNRNYTTQDLEDYNISIIDEDGERPVVDSKHTKEETYIEEPFIHDVTFAEDPLADYSNADESAHDQSTLVENEHTDDTPMDRKPRRTYNFATRDEILVKNRISNPTLKRPVFKNRTRDDSIGKTLSVLKDALQKESFSQSTNEFMAFGNSVGMQLQQMPLEIAIQTQSDIQSIISNTRLRHIRMNSTN